MMTEKAKISSETQRGQTLAGEEMILPIGQVEPWADNPRIVKKRDYDRLKAQVARLGKYKRLLVCPNPGKPGFFIVLGGNTRWHALRDLGDTEVAVTIIHPEDRAEMLEYALSDNDHVGQTDEQALAELTYPVRDKIKLEIYRVDVGVTAGLESVLTSFGPGPESTPEDTVPDAVVESDIRLGDLFDLGPHRLLCGDATEPWSYQALLGKKCTCPHCGEENTVD